MHDGAAVMIEDGVVLVLAAECETGLTALACTVVVRGAQVPAPRPLQQIAAERRHIADLWARRMAGGGSVSCIAFKNDWVVGDVRERDHGAYAYRTVLLLDNLVEPGDAAEIYDAARLQQALLHEVEKVDSARLDDNGILQRPPRRLGTIMPAATGVPPEPAASASDCAFTHSKRCISSAPTRDAAKCGEHGRRRYRQLSQPHADCVVDGVGNGGRGGDI